MKPGHQQQRDRVVEARLALQRPGQAAPHVRAAQHGEDRGAVGGGDRGADDQALEQTRLNSQRRQRPVITAVTTVPIAGQRDRGPDHRADLAPAGGEPALEQDQDQADRAQRPRQLGVGEIDAADAPPSRSGSRGRGRAAGRGRGPGRRPSRPPGRRPSAGPATRISSRVARTDVSARLVGAGQRWPRSPRRPGRDPGLRRRARGARSQQARGQDERGAERSRPRSAAPRRAPGSGPRSGSRWRTPPSRPRPRRARPWASAAWLSVVAARYRPIPAVTSSSPTRS